MVANVAVGGAVCCDRCGSGGLVSSLQVQDARYFGGPGRAGAGQEMKWVQGGVWFQGQRCWDQWSKN